MKTLLTLAAARLSLFYNFTFSMLPFQLQPLLRLAQTLWGSCLEMLLASPCPIFTLTTLLIKENEYFVTVDSFFVVVGGTFYL